MQHVTDFHAQPGEPTPQERRPPPDTDHPPSSPGTALACPGASVSSPPRGGRALTARVPDQATRLTPTPPNWITRLARALFRSEDVLARSTTLEVVSDRHGSRRTVRDRRFDRHRPCPECLGLSGWTDRICTACGGRQPDWFSIPDDPGEGQVPIPDRRHGEPGPDPGREGPESPGRCSENFHEDTPAPATPSSAAEGFRPRPVRG